MNGWIDAKTLLPKMHTAKVDEPDGDVYEWEESDTVAAIAESLGGDKQIIMGRYVRENGKFFFENDTLWNTGDPDFWFPLPDISKAVDTGKNPRVCCYCGDHNYYAKGLCRNCYNRMLRNGTLERLERKKRRNKVGKICEVWSECKSATETARIVGCTPGYVSNIVARQGLRERKPKFGQDEWVKRIAYNIFGKDETVPDNFEDNLLNAIGFLKERQRVFFLEYFKEGKTLDRIGKENGVSRERVRQIISRALFNLRNQKMRKYLLGQAEENDLRKNASFGSEPIEELGLRVRTYNCIRRIGIETVQELVEYVKTHDVRKIRNCGAKTAEEIERVVAEITAKGENV